LYLAVYIWPEGKRNACRYSSLTLNVLICVWLAGTDDLPWFTPSSV